MGRQRILLVATPLWGHVAPVLSVAVALSEAGHDVRVLTGPDFADAVAAVGVHFVALASPALPQDSPTASARPFGLMRPPWTDAIREAGAVFVAPLAGQHAAVEAELDRHPVDVVIADTGFLGVQPLMLGGPSATAPRIVGLSVTPISAVSIDAPPFGSALHPGVGARLERRNRQTQWLLDHGPLRPLQRRLDAALTECGVAPGTLHYFDQVTTFEQVFHLGVPELEYPRRELQPTVQMLGPVTPAVTAPLPAWWPDLDAARHIVHVTQGTLATDTTALLAPAITALAELPDVLVVVSTGGRPVEHLRRTFRGPLPTNMRLAPFLPYDQLLPRVSVLVTNGGYGTVQLTARYGVPMVVGGATQDKREVAARVAWAGIGINLRTARPTSGQIRRAVQDVLNTPSYRSRATQIRAAAELRPDPLTAITASVDVASPTDAAGLRRLRS